jgi:hypothetical protein
MKFYDLYGTRGMTTHELQEAAAAALRVSFAPRESSFKGAYYRADLGDENFAIYVNFKDPRYEDEILRPQFADYPVLLFVNRTERADELRDRLLEVPGLVHLRRDTRD